MESFFLYNLKKLLSKYNFSKVFDLQNSKRTKFYKRFILGKMEWSSSETTLSDGQTKKDFDAFPVLDRMELQLKKSGIPTKFIKNIDLSWAKGDLSEITSVASGDTLIAVDASGGGLKKVTRATLVAGLASSSAISNVVEDTTPQLGGDLDVNSNALVSTSNGNIARVLVFAAYFFPSG